MTPNASSFADLSRNKRYGSFRGIRGASIVQAPIPIQTSSLRAETGKDLSTVLVKTPGKKSCWGSAAKVSKEESEVEDRETSKATERGTKEEAKNDSSVPTVRVEQNQTEVPKSQNGGNTTNNDGRDSSSSEPAEPSDEQRASRRLRGMRDWSGPSDPDYTLERSEASRLRRDAERRESSGGAWGGQRPADPRPTQQPAQKMIIKKVMKRLASAPRDRVSTQRTVDTHGKQEREQQEENIQEKTEVAGCPDKAERGEGRAPPSEKPTWVDPIDSIRDEKEKAKKRQDIAMEQQRLVLRQVEAARALRRKQDEEKQAAVRAPPPKVLEEQTVAEERRRHRATRRPRTMGVLFKRLPDGSLVRVDRAGNPLPKPTTESTSDNDEATTGKESGQSNESEVGDDDDDGSNSEPDTKPFVPAPIPKVSAWTQGPPASFARVLRQKEVEKENAQVDEPQEENFSKDEGLEITETAGPTPKVSKATSELDVKGSVDRSEKGKKANKPGKAGAKKPFHKVRKPDRVGNKGRNAKKSFKKHPTSESVRSKGPRGVHFNQRKPRKQQVAANDEKH